MKIKILFISIMAVLLLSGAFFMFSGKSNIAGNAISSGEYDEFAQCLTEKGIKMYGTDWCSYCQKQKDLFGSSFNYIDFVDCDKDKQECLSAGVRGYPTWKINGENYPGLQSLDKLAQLSGCELK